MSKSDSSSGKKNGSRSGSSSKDKQSSDAQKPKLQSKLRRAADAPSFESTRTDEKDLSKFDSEKKQKTENDIRMEAIAFTGVRLREALPSEREELLSQRFKLCSVRYDFRKDTMSREKEAKRQALVELIDYVSNASNGLNEVALKEAIDMVAANIFRSLDSKERNPLELMDMDDEDLYEDVAWPHLQLVYEFLLRFVSSKDIDVKVAQQFVNASFIEGLLGLLDSDDVREREIIRSIMQKYYNRYTTMRPEIRKALQHACLRQAYESEFANGVAELLELMVKVINSFTVPLKPDSKQLLINVLLPLHKAQLFFSFQDQLTKCLMLYIEKDPKLCHVILSALLSTWPCTNGPKQVLFIEELEDLIKHLPAADFPRILPGFVHRLTLCITCPHSQVAERALRLWDVSSFTKLINGNRQTTFPLIIDALYRNATEHWSGNVHGRTFDVLKQLMEADENMFSESSVRHRRQVEEDENKEAARDRKWAVLQERFDKKERERQALAARKAKQEKASAPKAEPKAEPKPMASVLASHMAQSQQIRQDIRSLAGVNYGLCVLDNSCDLQALVIDNKGEVISVVSTGNYTALNAAVVHIGSVPGRRSRTKSHGVAVWVTLSRLPAIARQIYFFLCPIDQKAINGKSPLIAVRFVDVIANENSLDFSVNFEMSRIHVIASIERDGYDSWSFARICLPLSKQPEVSTKNSRHFMNVLECIGTLVRDKIPSVARPLRMCLDAEKGSVIELPVALIPNRFFLCAGWDPTDNGYLDEVPMTVDVSASVFGVNGKELGVVFADGPDGFGICHSGAGLLSASIAMTLKDIPDQVSQIFLVAHVSNPSPTSSSIRSPTCRIIDDKGTCISHFSVHEHSNKSCLIFGRLQLELESKLWRFQALGSFCSGQTHKDIETSRMLQTLFQRSLSEFQRRPDSSKAPVFVKNGHLSESL